MTEKIYVVCDKCGHATFSGMTVDESAIETLKLSNNMTPCKCGHEVLWSKAEVWPESVLRKHRSAGA
jgi:hypothetical protein